MLVASASAQLTKLHAAYSAESSWSLATWLAGRLTDMILGPPKDED
jgi:hypothetical protein